MRYGVDMDTESTMVSCTVVDVQAVNKGRLIALATVDVEIDGVVIRIDGIQIVRMPPTAKRSEMTGVDLPRYRAADGAWKQAIQLPDEVRIPIGDAVLDRCCEEGITKRLHRPALA